MTSKERRSYFNSTEIHRVYPLQMMVSGEGKPNLSIHHPSHQGGKQKKKTPTSGFETSLPTCEQNTTSPAHESGGQSRPGEMAPVITVRRPLFSFALIGK